LYLVLNFATISVSKLKNFGTGLHESVLSMVGLTGDVELDGIYDKVKNPAQIHEEGKVQPKITNAGIKKFIGTVTKRSQNIRLSLSLGLIFNNSVFKTLSPSLVIGLEVLFYHDIMMKNSSLAIYPQALVRITSTLSVQLGLGFYFEAEKFVPQFAYRVINESV
jgi:hypothetical protein